MASVYIHLPAHRMDQIFRSKARIDSAICFWTGLYWAGLCQAGCVAGGLHGTCDGRGGPAGTLQPAAQLALGKARAFTTFACLSSGAVWMKTCCFPHCRAELGLWGSQSVEADVTSDHALSPTNYTLLPTSTLLLPRMLNAGACDATVNKPVEA